MKKVYYMASNKKEAIERAKNDIKKDFKIKLHKFLSKGNSLYEIINL